MHDVLQNRVDVDAMLGDRIEHRCGSTRHVRNASQREDDFLLVMGDTRDDRLFHAFLSNPGSLLVREGRAGVHTHTMITSQLHRTEHQHFCARRRHLQHLVIRNAWLLTSVRDDAWIGGEDTRHIRVDLARRTQRSSQRDGRGV